MKIDIGCGQEQSIREGFTGIDAKFGGKAWFPLSYNDGTPVADASCDVIVGSHILEHAGHRVTEAVLQHWVSKLKPGGLIKLAVPDLEYIAQRYLSGAPGQYAGWLYGGQVDQNDIHGNAFDFDSLSAMMRRAGLVGLHYWGLPGEQDNDCSALEVSLNLAGFKRPEKWPETVAVMSRPRLGFGDHSDDALEALLPLGISRFSRTGAYFGKALANGIEDAIKTGAEYVLCMDYDTIFRQEHVEDLLALMAVKPEADALIPMQMGRGMDKVLMNPLDAGKKGITMSELEQTYYPVRTGNFGLTLFRASAFEKVKRPWFQHSFNEDGTHKYDEDIMFWLQFEEAGLKAFLTPRIVIGHIDWVILWPDQKCKTLYQTMNDYRAEGKPRRVWR